MLRPTAVKVQPLENYKVKIKFDNGEKKIFDVKPYIEGSWYGQLKNKLYFNQVKTDGYTIVWPDGQDICPDDVYYTNIPI